MDAPMPPWVAQYVGIPFVDHGRDLAGFDCWGLCRHVWHAHFGIEVPSYAESYRASREADVAFHTELPTSGWVPTPAEGAQPGDALLLRVRGLPLHVGVYLGHGRFLHAAPTLGTVVDRLDSPLWARRVLGFYRYAR